MEIILSVARIPRKPKQNMVVISMSMDGVFLRKEEKNHMQVDRYLGSIGRKAVSR